MGRLGTGASLALCLCAMAAHAADRYDRKLEKAVADIVASKIGDIRGGLPCCAPPVLVTQGEKDRPVPADGRKEITGRIVWR